MPEVSDVHVIPSREVRIVPFSPTATNFVPDQVMPKKEVAVTENEALDVTVPPGAVMINGPVKLAMEGMVITICVLDALTTGAVTPLSVTVLFAAKFVPDMVTVVPGEPLVGVKLEIVGAGIGVVDE